MNSVPKDKPGRKQKYLTEEEIIRANREKAKRYYYRNKKIICENRMQRYYQQKQNKEVMEGV